MKNSSSSMDWRILRQTLPLLWPKDHTALRVRVVIALSLLILAKLATVTTPIIFKYVVDALVGTEPTPQTLLLIGPIGLVVGYALVRFMTVGFAELRDALFAKVAQRALRIMARRTFSHLHALSLRFHLSRRTGALTRITERGIKSIGFVLRFVLFSLVPLIIELAMVAVIFLVELNIWYFVVVIGTMALYIVYTLMMTNYRLKLREAMNHHDSESAQRAVDSLLNFETVKAFTAEERETLHYDGHMKQYEDASVKTQTSLSALNVGQSFIITIGLCAVLVMAGRGVIAGTLTVGDFVMVNTFMLQITVPLNFLGTVYRETRQSILDMREMFDLLDKPAEITDSPNAPSMVVSDAVVTFDHVSFRYDESRPILRDVSFTIPSGKTLAIVGHSGSGKSTIARLVMRLYDINEGGIFIDHQPIHTVTQHSLRSHIGLVPQDTVLFNETIGYNIAYGREGATQHDIEKAAQAANIHTFIQSLPEGYDTRVGERGLKLSGGEKQRVAIARVFLKNPPILILDEATSALDTHTEQTILDNLRDLSRNRTVITIAHRLSTIVHADEILVLDKGVIVERGIHSDLLQQGGVYFQMWERQKSR
jgi:ATP-binding cassette, subfamily B, heavy metal transporter